MVTSLLAGGEGDTLTHAYCHAFENLSDFIRDHSAKDNDAEYLNFAGLEVSTEASLDDNVMKIETTINHGEKFIICESKYEETDSGLVDFQNLTRVLDKEEPPLNLMENFDDGKCLYASLERGYHVDEDYFSVQIGFKCKLGFLRLY